MTKDEALDKAIERVKGRDLPLGTVVAVKQHPLSMNLIRYEGNKAICDDGKGEKVYPKSDVFEIRKVMNVARHYLNVGFWEEGMECTIISIGENKK
jgi:hypothetical protein